MWLQIVLCAWLSIGSSFAALKSGIRFRPFSEPFLVPFRRRSASSILPKADGLARAHARRFGIFLVQRMPVNHLVYPLTPTQLFWRYHIQFTASQDYCMYHEARSWFQKCSFASQTREIWGFDRFKIIVTKTKSVKHVWEAQSSTKRSTTILILELIVMTCVTKHNTAAVYLRTIFIHLINIEFSAFVTT